MTIFQTTKETPVFNRRQNPCFQSSAKPLFLVVGRTDVFLGNGRFSWQRLSSGNRLTILTNVFSRHSVGFVVKTGRRIFLIVPERFSAPNVFRRPFVVCCERLSDECFFLCTPRRQQASTASFDSKLTEVFSMSKLRRQALLASPYFALHCLVPLSATVAIEISYDFASFTALLASLCASLWRDSSLEQFCHHVW